MQNLESLQCLILIVVSFRKGLGHWLRTYLGVWDHEAENQLKSLGESGGK